MSLTWRHTRVSSESQGGGHIHVFLTRDKEGGGALILTAGGIFDKVTVFDLQHLDVSDLANLVILVSFLFVMIK
jgi:hypothetical protein